VIDKRQLRQQKRRLRCHLSDNDQQLHANAVARHLATLPHFKRSRRIALYFSTKGEIDTTPLLQRLRHLGKKSYYPALHYRPAPLLWFIEHRKGEPLINNQFSIPEPSIRLRQPTKPWALDLVIMPLVAFDADCNRLGMGGGYYDRTFAYLNKRRFWRKPILIGVAHECQRVANLESEVWDIPLDAVVTEEKIYVPSGAI
jgi:5-formyltetrahydrofolate cyclo-ligase